VWRLGKRKGWVRMVKAGNVPEGATHRNQDTGCIQSLTLLAHQTTLVVHSSPQAWEVAAVAAAGRCSCQHYCWHCRLLLHHCLQPRPQLQETQRQQRQQLLLLLPPLPAAAVLPALPVGWPCHVARGLLLQPPLLPLLPLGS
jgi:hypothetical protein